MGERLIPNGDADPQGGSEDLQALRGHHPTAQGRRRSDLNRAGLSVPSGKRKYSVEVLDAQYRALHRQAIEGPKQETRELEGPAAESEAASWGMDDCFSELLT